MSGRRAAVLAGLRARARPLAVWWLFLALMFGAFCAAALIEDPGTDSLVALGILAAITLPCAALGQVLALLRLRDWVLAAVWVGCAALAVALGLGAALAGGPAGAPVAIFVALLLFLGPMFLIGGAWSVQSGRALFGAWVPLVYASGTAIVMAESSGRVAEWHAGAKWAIWDVFTFSVLAASIVLFLAYLAAREAHRLHLWRTAPGGPLRGSVVEDGAARPRLTLGGWVLVLVLAGGLSVGTAALAPYLWRTAPAEDGPGGGGGGGAGGEAGGGAAASGGGPGGGGTRPGGRAERPMGSPTEEMQRNLQPLRSSGVDPLATLITLLALAALGLLLGGPPARRLLWERRLRAPPWRVPPARRVQELWALVSMMLGDLGVPAREGEPAESHVARARAALGALPSTDAEIAGLAEAAAIADRVRFGLGMAPGDVAAMERAACWAADTAWERLGERAQLRALYRWG